MGERKKDTVEATERINVTKFIYISERDDILIF